MPAGSNSNTTTPGEASSLMSMFEPLTNNTELSDSKDVDADGADETNPKSPPSATSKNAQTSSSSSALPGMFFEPPSNKKLKASSPAHASSARTTAELAASIPSAPSLAASIPISNPTSPRKTPASSSATLLSMLEAPAPTRKSTTSTAAAAAISASSPPDWTSAGAMTSSSPGSNSQRQRSSLIPPPNAINPNERQSTIRQSNVRGRAVISEQTSLLQSLFANDNDNSDDRTPRPTKNLNKFNALFKTYDTVGGATVESADVFQTLLAPPLIAGANGNSQLQLQHHQQQQQQHPEEEEAVHYEPVKQPLDEDGYSKRQGNGNLSNHIASSLSLLLSSFSWNDFRQRHLQPSTFAGAFMFLLYNVVFCLANGSAIVRPHASQPILGEMAKLTAVGILFAGPFYIARLGQDIPAVYPSVDLFLAPFLASAAANVDKTLEEDGIGGSSSNAVFLASFAVLAAIGMFAAGSLLLLAATFKLANIGLYLPYSVLCGFFSAVGVLLWALAFSVDTNGKTWQHVFFSGDTSLIIESVIHHLPSLIVGILMNLLGPKHPFYVILLIIITLVTFYTTMWATGTSLEEAQEQQWFWSREELSIQSSGAEGILASWTPPLPFGHFGALFQGLVHWRAVRNGLKDMFALAFLYLLRSSIHASAMKKNINNLVCKKRIKREMAETTKSTNNNVQTTEEQSYTKAAMEAISDNVRLVNESLARTQNASGARQSIRPIKSPAPRTGPQSKLELPKEATKEDSTEYDYIEVRPKPCRRSLRDIFVEYGFALMLVAFSGGFGVCPTVATSNTMFAIGAGGPAPQYGSVLLLIVFYATDFELVRYIPKACFSSLLVLGAVDTFVVWFFVSYKKTQDLMEWMVCPVLVLCSMVVGFLPAVFLGIGLSFFVFTAAFFRVGVVKFNSTGLEIRSTIERSIIISDWLDIHGDYIQVLCLQSYLFFGNASSLSTYIATMFEDDVELYGVGHLSEDLPPVPKVLIIDMSLNTGMDTSTLDIFAEIKELCKNNNCKLFLCGLSNRAKKGLALTGVKPEPGFRDQRLVRFFPDLDVALGRAEDLISLDLQEKEKFDFARSARSPGSVSSSGFQTALKLIDEQHGQEFSKSLLDLEPHTVAIELQAGDCLFACDGGSVQDSERGLFFIETGMLKIERDANATLTRGRSTVTRNRSFGTLNNLHARSGTVGRQRAALKAASRVPMTKTFRLARIGPGWVCGAIEGASGLKEDGVHIAVTNCRLHHLSFQKLEQMEKDHPLLILSLYKMLSHLMARRQEITIEQLATFHSIMSSPAHSKPISRAALMTLRR